MEQVDEAVAVGVIDSVHCLLANNLDLDAAMTIIALVSEDPANWEEAMSVWNRYRTPAVNEFVSNLPLESTSREEMIQAIRSSEAWVVIDFLNKRICTGGEFMEVGRDAVFAMVVDESDKHHCPLSVHVPPWWELHEGVSAEVVNESRQAPMDRPSVDRDLLYGKVFLTELASKIIDVASSDAWRESEASDNVQGRYQFTVNVHREWLMTPREDLGGRIPRQLLHGATDWIEKVTEGQRRRFEDGGPMVAAPNDWAGFASAPMGSQEMCIYFDLCREVIDAGWTWCASDEGKLALQNRVNAQAELAQYLREVKEEWLSNPLEGNSPPIFIIECDRRRVPRGAGVAIEGIDEVQSEQHIADCDCPICEMMADGMFGIAFARIDGHHLELDDEFAFSTRETFEEWEEERCEFAEFSAKMDRNQAEREAYAEADDLFASAWSGLKNDDAFAGTSPFAGKQGGLLKLAFMVTEVVSELEACSDSRDDIKSLNEFFSNYRRCDESHRPQRASELKANLQLLAERYPQLISKSADLQSRIDEAGRALAFDDDDDGSDVSF